MILVSELFNKLKADGLNKFPFTHKLWICLNLKRKNWRRYEFRVRKAQISNERIDRPNRESGKQLKYR